MSLNDNSPAQLAPAYGVAVDMGASHLRFALADRNAAIVEESREPVNSEAGARGVIAQIRDGIRRLVPPGEPLIGIAIGVPGAVNPQTGKVFDANNVPGWQEVDLGQELPMARPKASFSRARSRAYLLGGPEGARPVEPRRRRGHRREPALVCRARPDERRAQQVRLLDDRETPLDALPGGAPVAAVAVDRARRDERAPMRER